MRTIFLRAATAALLCLMVQPVYAGSVTLGWDRNTEPSVTGYQIVVGTTPTGTAWTVDVGNNIQGTVPNLKAGTTYYFSVRAYTATGVFSDPSASVSFTDPIILPTGRLTYDAVSGTWSSPIHDQLGNTPANGPGWTVFTGDFNGDGWKDLFLYNQTTGAFLRAVDEHDGNYHFFGYNWAPNWTPTVADFNGDGLSDVFLYNKTTGKYFMCLAVRGADDFSYLTGAWGAGWNITTGDFNGDGRTDLFLYNTNPASDSNSGRFYRVLTQADGSFGYIPGDARWATDWQVTAADFNGDGRTDLFLYRPNGQWFQVFFTATSESYLGGMWGAGWTITPGDFNGDHQSDLFLYNNTTGRWFTVITQADLSFAYHEGLWAGGWQIRPTDFNGDGRTDLLLYNVTNGHWFEALTLDASGVFGFASGTGVASSTLTVIR